MKFRLRYSSCLTVLALGLLLAQSGCRSQLGSVYGVATGKTTAADVIPAGVARRGAPEPVTQASFAPPPAASDSQAGAAINTAPVTTTVSSPLENPTRDQAFAAIIGDLQQLGAENPKAQQELLRQLQTAEPKHWDLLVRRFKSELAYHQQIKSGGRSAALPASHTESSSSQPPPIDTHNTHRPAIAPGEGYPETGATTPEIIVREPDPVDRVNRNVAKETASAIQLVGASSPTTNVKPAVIENKAAIYEIESQRQAPKDWREAVDTAIAALEAEAPAQPESTAEAYLHARQRLLHLAAGNLDEAVRPIPGLSTTEQNYWAKQLFALSTLLDASTQRDVKRRAAASGIHLAEAQASLSQLGSLSVRNLTFCTEVIGYGAYRERKIRRFQAGEEVSLYVEVENFRTDETSEGYHTTIGTSYKIVDKGGNRVDGREFPAVDDYCLSRRRDFHIQYGINLPERIYPGEYQLELTLTDQLGSKIGHASVDFEIVEQ